MPFRKEDGSMLEAGDVVRFGPGPRITTVDIWGDNFAMVSPPDGRDVYVGDFDQKKRRFKKFPIIFTPTEDDRRMVVDRESISVNNRSVRVLWTKK